MRIAMMLSTVIPLTLAFFSDSTHAVLTSNSAYVSSLSESSPVNPSCRIRSTNASFGVNVEFPSNAPSCTVPAQANVPGSAFSVTFSCAPSRDRSARVIPLSRLARSSLLKFPQCLWPLQSSSPICSRSIPDLSPALIAQCACSVSSAPAPAGTPIRTTATAPANHPRKDIRPPSRPSRRSSPVPPGIYAGRTHSSGLFLITSRRPGCPRSGSAPAS